MNTPPRISTALCTFNGARYLPDQLASLAAQTRLPDELVIFDDGSTDQTVNIAEQFASRASFPVHLRRNESNLGPAQNFAAAIAACSGEIIFFCDQDDVWEVNKIERAMAEYDRDPTLGFVFSDAHICDANGQPMGYSLWSSVGFSPALQKRFEFSGALDVLLRQNVVTGATMSFSAQYRPLVLPIPAGWMHDGWIALLLSAVGHGKAIDRPLLKYRQHAEQSVGAEKRSLYQQYLNAKQMDRRVFAEQADQFEAALARLQEQTDYEVPGVVIARLQAKIRHCRRRSEIRLRTTARVPAALVELIAGRYQRFSLGWKSFAQDLFL